METHVYRNSPATGLTARHGAAVRHYRKVATEACSANHRGFGLATKQRSRGNILVEGPVCCRQDTPAIFHEDFINSGYRRPRDVTDCLRGCFRWHNETMNIWTHTLGLFLSGWRLIVMIQNVRKMQTLSGSEEEADDITRLWAPLVLFGTSVTLVCFTSASAHCFNSLTPRWHHICFMFDYLSIGFCFVASALAHFYYCAPNRTNPIAVFFSYPLTYLITAALVNVLAFLTMSLLRLSVPGIIRSVVIPLAALCPYVFIISPTLTRYAFCQAEESCEIVAKSSMAYHWAQLSFTFFGAVFMASKVPERFAPGVFDIIGHSHQLMHVVTFLAAWFDWTAMEIDVNNRWTELRHSDIQPSSALTILLPSIYMCVGFAGLVIIARRINQQGKWK